MDVGHQSIQTAISNMFKFVVVFAFVAAAVAEPDVLLSSPYVQPYSAYSTLVSPATTSYSSSSSSVIHPSPITYSTLGFPHFIKKRSAEPQFLATTYSSPYNYYPTNYWSAPGLISSPTVYGAAHLIKKRSADPQLLASPYYTSSTYLDSPLISSPYLQTPYLANAGIPLVNTHFIKKRSAEPTPEPAANPQTLISSPYFASSGYVNSIATPYLSSPLLSSYYPSAYPYAHLIKKRSAEAAPAPAADPQFISTYPTSYYGYGSAAIPYASSTLLNSAPIFSANPYVYSSYIKK